MLVEVDVELTVDEVTSMLLTELPDDVGEMVLVDDMAVDVAALEIEIVLVKKVLDPEEEERTDEAELELLDTAVAGMEVNTIELDVEDTPWAEPEAVVEEEGEAIKRAPSTPLVTAAPTLDFI